MDGCSPGELDVLQLMALLMPSKCFAGNSSLISQWFLGLFQWFKVVDIGFQ